MEKAKITFILDDYYTKTKVMREAEIADTLDDIIEELRFFLIGCTWTNEQIDRAFKKSWEDELYNGN